jgi:hypothetical protein
MVLLFVLIFFLGYLSGSGFLGMDISVGHTSKLDFILSECVNPVSVENAKWQVSILVSNPGKHSLLLSHVYVNETEVNLYGLIHGDCLDDGTQLGTSIPLEGLRVEPSELYNVYIWVGDKLFNNDSQIIITFNEPSSDTLKETITLPNLPASYINAYAKEWSKTYVGEL